MTNIRNRLTQCIDSKERLDSYPWVLLRLKKRKLCCPTLHLQKNADRSNLSNFQLQYYYSKLLFRYLDRWFGATGVLARLKFSAHTGAVVYKLWLIRLAFCELTIKVLICAYIYRIRNILTYFNTCTSTYFITWSVQFLNAYHFVTLRCTLLEMCHAKLLLDLAIYILS